MPPAYTRDYMDTLESVKNMSPMVQWYLMREVLPTHAGPLIEDGMVEQVLTKKLYWAIWPGRSQHTESLSY